MDLTVLLMVLGVPPDLAALLAAAAPGLMPVLLSLLLLAVPGLAAPLAAILPRPAVGSRWATLRAVLDAAAFNYANAANAPRLPAAGP